MKSVKSCVFVGRPPFAPTQSGDRTTLRSTFSPLAGPALAVAAGVADGAAVGALGALAAGAVGAAGAAVGGAVGEGASVAVGVALPPPQPTSIRMRRNKPQRRIKPHILSRDSDR